MLLQNNTMLSYQWLSLYVFFSEGTYVYFQRFEAPCSRNTSNNNKLTNVFMTFEM